MPKSAQDLRGEALASVSEGDSSESARRIDGVSAVVCNYNGREYLEDCLRSVLAQNPDEVIVVDNASDDGSRELVRERFPEVELIALAANDGPCVARNVGMRAARHRFVLAVDNDAVLEAGVLAKLRAALEERPDAVVAQPRSVVHDDPSTVHYDGGAFHYVGLLALRNFYRPRAEAEAEDERRGRVVDTDALIGISPLLDRDVVLSVGGYDEAFFYLAEDYDLALRLRLTGARILAVGDAVVLHRGGTAGLSFRGGGYPQARTRLHAKNRWRVVAKAYRARTLLLAAPGLLLYELVWLAFALLQGQLGAHLAGKLAFLRELPSACAARRAVQRSRRVPDRELLVGGPLTLSPSLVEKPLARFLSRGVDLTLGAWWTLVRPFCG